MSDLSHRLASLSPEKRALLERRLGPAREQTAPATPQADEPLAIIGMACRFPGADSPDELWTVVREGRDAVTTVPADRWDAAAWYAPDPSTPGTINSCAGAFLSDVDRFDAAFFGISPREAQRMDPQQRLLLEVAWNALEDAGLDVDRLAGSRTGVFLGLHSHSNDYFSRQLDAPEHFDAFTGTGSAHNIAAGRLSYLWDLRGPAIVVDTACSSSLVGLHLACQSLRQRESTLAIAAGVNLILGPAFSVALARTQMLSPTGRCHAFDAAADGFVRGEGCGVVILKRLAEAERDGDRIIAVIRGSALNQDGRTNGITAPSSHSQQDVIRRALAAAGLRPGDLSYLEAHGTGTPIGDPIEIEALSTVFAGRSADQVPVTLGAVKGNIGHLEGAAGIAGVIKVALALQHRTIPPVALFTRLNPHISLEGTPLQVPQAAVPWNATGLRRAGVSSFGWSGTNAHVILEEAPLAEVPLPTSLDAVVLPLSARSEGALLSLVGAVGESLEAGPLRDASLTDVVRYASRRRTHHEYRVAVAGETREEIIDGLNAVGRGDRRWNVQLGRAVSGRRRDTVFVFCGQGPQHPGMGVALLDAGGVYARTVEEISALVESEAGWSLLAAMRGEAGAPSLDETRVAQPALFALQVGLAREWQHSGVVPAAVLGHSLGEIAAAHVSGALSLEAAVSLVVNRGRLMQQATGKGRMVHAELDEVAAQKIADRFNGRLSLAAVNAPFSCVLSGDTDAIEAATDELRSDGVACKALPVNYAFHSHQVEPILEELRAATIDIAAAPPSIPFISTVTGGRVEAAALTADHWVNNVRRTVRFADAIAAVSPGGHTVFLELGPHPVLAASIEETLVHHTREGTAVASLHRGRPATASVMGALGALYVHRTDVDWAATYPGPATAVALPPYPWQRERHWLPPRASQATAARAAGSLAGRRLRSPSLDGVVFETEWSSRSPASFGDHLVDGVSVCPAAAYIALAVDAAQSAFGTPDIDLADVLFPAPLTLTDAPTLVQTILRRTADASVWRFEVVSLRPGSENEWITHATGEARAGEDGIELDVRPVDGAAPADVQAHYSALEASGVTFGPLFRCITELGTGPGTAHARLTLPENADTMTATLHPVWVDGAFHAVWAAASHSQPHRETMLPFAIAEVHVRGGTPGVSEVVASAVAHDGMRGDVVLTSAGRDLSVIVRGLAFRPIPRSSKGEPGHAQIPPWLHQVAWQALSVAPVENPTPRRLLLVTDSADGPAIDEFASFCAQHAVAFTSADARTVTDAQVEEWARGGTTGGADRIVFAATEQGVMGSLSGEDLASAAADACATLATVVRGISRAAKTVSVDVITIAGLSVRADEVAPLRAGVVAEALSAAARSVRRELPELRLRHVDLAGDAPPSAVTQAWATLPPDGPAECAERGGAWFERGVVRASLPERPDPPSDEPELRVVLGTPGSGLDGVRLEPAFRRPPDIGEVEIRVRAAGLNFRDVLMALDLYPGPAAAAGSEAAGTVITVGEGVADLSVGDEVLAVGEGTLGTYLTTSAKLCVKRPISCSAVGAAGVPIAYLTAYEALVACAGVKRGDRVLVHAAAGGVGIAAVQLALHLGAEVIATAGSDHKREFVRGLGALHVFDSRSPGFANDLLTATGGRGVDVVLNSLSGAFIEESVRVLAPSGRFVEIGKNTIWTPAEMAARRPDVQYHVLYLGDLFTSDPERLRSMFESVVALIESGAIGEMPLTTFPLAGISSAMRYMAQARHVGKVVIDLERSTAHATRVRPDASYLVTGGLGALGTQIAEWLASEGARHLWLCGRHVPDHAPESVTRLRAAGVRVETVACDVGDLEATRALVDRIATEGPPLRGVIHAAGVLDDGVAMQLDRERMLRVMSPKVAGAWNLHESTMRMALDFFVLFSGAAAVIGSAGQSNYAAANAALDAIARTRRAEGRPAVSIAWGPWEGSGMAGSLSARDRDRLGALGLRAMAPRRAFDVLGRMLGEAPAAVCVMDVNAQAWQRADDAVRPRAGDMTAAPVAAPARPAPLEVISLAARLAEAPRAQRRALLQRHVRDRALQVLGLPASFALDAHQGLRDVGLDSLLAIELRNLLQVDTAMTLSATLAFDYPTVDALTRFLEAQLAPSAEQGAPEAAIAPATDGTLDELTDEEAERLLLEELGTMPATRGDDHG